jgi:hypothetical protein
MKDLRIVRSISPVLAGTLTAARSIVDRSSRKGE